MEKENKRQYRVCFTGHRPERMGKTEQEVKELLRPALLQAIGDGYKTFITGMARGFDLWAADMVLAEKRNYPHIHLICALPFEGFEQRWNQEDRAHYHKILAQADHIAVVCPCYDISCFQRRNIFMVDRSARVIAAYTGGTGGTYNTLRYAKSQGVDVVNIFPPVV